MWKSTIMPTHVGILATAFFIALFNTAAISAPSLDNGGSTISLLEAINKTIKHNPDLQAFDYKLKAQDGRVQQAGLAPSPELDLELEDVLGTGDYKTLDNAKATISISWVLERGVRQHQIDVARVGSSVLSVDADIKKLDVAAETAHRYLVSLAYQARMTNTDKTVQLAEETVRAVQKRVRAGKSPDAELSRARAELARRQLEREDIEHELVSANRRLAAQWGETSPDFARVEGDIVSLPKLASYETLRSQLQQNPEFTRLLSEQRLKKAELELAQMQNTPSWRVKAGLRHIQGGNNSSDDQAFVAGITIPFGERTRNPGRIAEASANLERLNLEEKITRVRIETALFVLYQKLQHSLHVIHTLRDEIIPPLEQALKETRRAYNLGRYSYLEWRSVQAESLGAHEALIEASIDAHRNVIEIERLTGVRIAQQTTKL